MEYTYLCNIYECVCGYAIYKRMSVKKKKHP